MKKQKIMTRIVNFLAIYDEKQSITGDFEEEYLMVAAEKGKFKAIRWYLLQILVSIYPFFKTAVLNNFGMAISYIKLAKRNIIRNKLTSTINIFGFSTALATCLVIYVIINSMETGNNFHEKFDKIYTTLSTYTTPEGEEINGLSPIPLGISLSTEFPQIENFTRYDIIGASVENRGRNFDERLLKVDKEFFDIFTFPLEKGSVSSLDGAKWIVLSNPAAEKYFGDTEPLGKELHIQYSDGQTTSFIVAGVLKEISFLSSIKPDIIIPFESGISNKELTDWEKSITGTFFEIKDRRNIASIQEGMGKYVKQINSFDTVNKLKEISILSIGEIQLSKLKIKSSVFQPLDPLNYILNSILGILVLLSACFSYINMSLFGVSRRIKEIGLRKVVGANRKQLIFQFLAENLVLITFSMTVGFLICEYLFLPGLSALINTGVRLSIFDTNVLTVFQFLAILILITGFFSGIYPALIASKLNPSQIFKHGKIKKRRNVFARFSLTFQYVLAFVTIIFSIAFYQNTSFLNNIDWGYDQDHMIVVPVDSGNEYELLENLISNNNNIERIAGSVNNLGIGRKIKSEIEIDQKKINVGRFEIGPGYIESIGLNVIQGRAFDKDRVSDINNSIIINETFVKEMEWIDPLEKKIGFNGNIMNVIGVVTDFHYEGFDRVIEPVILKVTATDNFNFMTVKVKDGKVDETYSSIENAWKRMLPDVEFGGVLQSRIFENYRSSVKADWRGMGVMSIIILATTCMGLLGLMAMNIYKREKEIGVRKVLGASHSKIFILLSSNFLVLLFISFIIATPFSKFLLDSLFTLFPYHVPISISMFSLTYMIISVTLISIIIKLVLKAATANPIVVLKNE